MPVHFAILWGFSICLGGGGAGGGDAWRLAAGFFAAGCFGGAAGMRSSVAPLLMLVMRRAGAFLAAGLREGHCGGAPPPLLPPYILLLKIKLAHRSLCRPQRWLFPANGACYRCGYFISIPSCSGRPATAFIWFKTGRRGVCFSSWLAACNTLEKLVGRPS